MFPNQVDCIAHGKMAGLTAPIKLCSMTFSTGCLHSCRACRLCNQALMGNLFFIGLVVALMTVRAGNMRNIMGFVKLYLLMTGLATRSWGRWQFFLDGLGCWCWRRRWNRVDFLFLFTASHKYEV
ncbi:MAG: hypothetical protein D3919_09770 [Candidatus Electrothrix sp. AW5]|nr:hypothetical protein [Candidatus Electrothrix gigas]